MLLMDTVLDLLTLIEGQSHESAQALIATGVMPTGVMSGQSVNKFVLATYGSVMPNAHRLLWTMHSIPSNLGGYMDRKLLIKLNANRMVVGTLCWFDQFMNLVVGNTVEVNGNEKTDTGMVVSLCLFLLLADDQLLIDMTDGWLLEMAKFTQKLKVLKYVGEKEHRCSLHKIMYKQVKEKSSSFDVSSLPFHIPLTTCDIALMVQDFLSQIPWYYAIIDEAQRLENPSNGDYYVKFE
ncbi:hypothetical protein Pint_06782 [Pistacia integerrima]|uniref:Uncharacterized protein n=1 Tax=Pistacia integerrima TaxID=434235 RepID=A0ACC0XXE6_9ROSI|nr:hypothetical protein Pint_06782 [Pistacia integerrima]